MARPPLHDALWSRIEPLLPHPRRRARWRGGRPRVSAVGEDLGDGDVTTAATIPPDLQTTARPIAGQPCVVTGLDVAAAVFRAVDQTIRLEGVTADCRRCAAGDEIARVHGSARRSHACEARGDLPVEVETWSLAEVDDAIAAAEEAEARARPEVAPRNASWVGLMQRSCGFDVLACPRVRTRLAYLPYICMIDT